VGLTTGLAPSPMPANADKMTSAERWDVVNYVLSLARTPPWEPGGKLDGPGQRTAPVARGQYLVHAEMCGLCHTQINATGIYRGDDYYLAGGMGIPLLGHALDVPAQLHAGGRPGDRIVPEDPSARAQPNSPRAALRGRRNHCRETRGLHEHPTAGAYTSKPT
jgi:hypothetical protein